MVKENTHRYIARLVFDRLRSDRLAAPIFAHLPEYYLGAVIPDSFMYLREAEKVAARLHGTNGEKTSEFIWRLIEYLKRHRDNERDRALLYGYLTHCAADITFHPMVWYLAGKPGDHGAMRAHFRIETYLDTVITGSEEAGGVRQRSRLRGLELPKLLALHLKLDKPFATIGRALRRQRYANVLFRTHGVYYIVRALSIFPSMRTLTGLFYADVRHGMLPESIRYRHPVSGTEHVASVHQLVEQSVRLSQRLVVCAHAYYENRITRRQAERILTGQSLETGLVGVGVQRMKYFAAQ